MRYQPTTSGGEAASADSDVLALATTELEETLIAAVAGDFAACDVWFSGPSDWLAASPAVVARLYARQGAARVMVGQISLVDAQRTDDRNGQSSAWVFSARGVESSGFELTCQRGSGGTNLSGGQFFVRAKTVATTPALLGTGGIDGLRSVAISNTVQVQPAGAVTVTQSQPSSLSATVVQSSAAALQVTAAQGAAGGASARWPTYLSDGTSPLGTTTNPFYVGRVRDASPTFSAATGLLSTGTTAALKGLAYLWRSNTKRIEINKITVTYVQGTTTSSPVPAVIFRAARISTNPGGTSVSATTMDTADSATVSVYSMTATVSAPSADVFAVAVPCTGSGVFEWCPSERAKPLVLRATANEGVVVFADVKTGVSTQMQATVGFEWVEV